MKSINVPMIKLNNGIEIPTLGIGPSGVKVKDSEFFFSPDNPLSKIERKLTYNLHMSINRRKYIKSIENALDMGYRLIDYSFAYGSGKEIVQAINNYGLKREEVFLTTRITNHQQFSGTVREGFLDGLKNMGLDYIDICMFHWPVTDHFVDTYKEMEQLHKEGYIRILGVANCHQHHLQAIFDNCSIVPAINQFEIHPLFTQKPLIEFCRKHGIAIEAYTPLARNDDRLSKNLILQGLAKKYNKTIQQIILRWHIQLEQIPIPSSHNPKRQFQNINVFDFSLTQEEIQAIDSININSRLRFDPDNLDFHSIG